MYVPQPVPTSLELLSQYLDNEFEQIAQFLNTTVQHAFGGFFQDSTSVSTPLTPTPVPFNPYDMMLPTVPVGVEVDATDGSLTVLSAGVYLLFFSTTGINIGNNQAFNFEVARNGVPGPFNGQLTPSNQTDTVTVTVSAVVTYDRGDKIQVLASSANSNTWESGQAMFFLHRISPQYD